MTATITATMNAALLEASAHGHAVRATLMRGGTSKGVFFAPDDPPAGMTEVVISTAY